ncbi:MAG: hypothetical protein V3U57_01070 [Robiginitomaculum sp.]
MKRNLFNTSLLFPALLSPVLLGALLLTAGCASTATGRANSAVLLKTQAETLQVKAPMGSVLTIIRYPAVVETAARDKYIEAFTNAPINGAVSGNAHGDPDTGTIADSVIVKSNYFALSLYKELVERMPEHSVLLSPHAVKLAKDGSLTSEPITKAESLGSATLIDFSIYSFPDAEKIMGNVPLTFGDLVTPLVVVRTDHRAAPATDGVLLASAPLLTQTAGQGERTTMKSMVAIEAGKFDTDTPELTFISYLSKKAGARVASGPLAFGQDKNQVQNYPLEKIVLNREALHLLETDSKDDIDPLESAFSSAFADRIIAILNDTDVEKAVMMRKASAISKFDSSLAALTLAGSPDADYKARLRYAERLLEAEKKYLSVQSLRIYDGIHNGEMGAQVRDMLKAEYSILEQRRALARKQNIATAVTLLGAVAAGAAIAKSGGGKYDFGKALLNQTLVNAVLFSATKAFFYRRQSAAVGSNYLSSIVPAIDEQTSVQVNLIDSNETITAIRFEDLQDKLQSLYRKNQRSLDTIATRCAYMPDNGSPKGAWMGVCENGLAAGPGTGVLRKSDGTAFEYFGDAQNGKANGAGYMIYHELKGSYSVEGNFTNGKPDGVMRVTKAGHPDVLRRYTSGQDMGAAPSGAKINSPFDIATMHILPAKKIARL